MKSTCQVAVIAGALLLSACGGSQANCTDEASTSAHMSKFMEDVANAATSGTLTEEQSDKAQAALMRYEGDPNDNAALCKWADDQRKTLGL